MQQTVQQTPGQTPRQMPGKMPGQQPGQPPTGKKLKWWLWVIIALVIIAAGLGIYLLFF